MHELFVNGTLMRGLALHGNLDGAEFAGAFRTAPHPPHVQDGFVAASTAFSTARSTRRAQKQNRSGLAAQNHFYFTTVLFF